MLTDIFRFHKNIAKVAKQFSRNRDNLESMVTKIEQKQPVFVDVDSQNEEAAEVANILRTLENHQKRIGIIAPHHQRLVKLKDELASYDIETTYFRGANKRFRNHDFTSRTPLLITAHSAKGLEFENVIVLGFNKSDMQWYSRDLDELIYVSFTRANSGLYVIRNSDTVDKIKQLQPETESVSTLDIEEIFG